MNHHKPCESSQHPNPPPTSAPARSPPQNPIHLKTFRKALSASKYVKFETPEKPDSVLAFFKSHGFTQTKISILARKFPPILLCDPEKTLLPKLEFLEPQVVSSTDVARIVSTSPFILRKNDRFGQIVKEFEKMGFNPSRVNFVSAIHASRAMKNSTWEKKVEVYKKWGWTEDEILVAFKKHPPCIMVSEGKIMWVMDFFGQ
ncbi:mitochondrial transcription termination factor family protein [Actinidia rufa]|uniref:Mitochondrial transcription termination factor family protein n=1 Tax=Actinidia rufa TaxID=165716 RepID=A0A7J0GXR9_9ERIC|nr:mitochondrial transcription termination factor family protein [Actinidia rufa]